MIRILLIFLLLVTQSFATTIKWDHDCNNTIGFYVYFSNSEIENPHRTVSVDCPAIQAVVFRPGRYSVTAYNNNDESTQSNNIELAQYYYNAIKMEYDVDGRVTYQGEHTTYNAATDDPNWVIKKYYYDTEGRITDLKIKVISWDDRAIGW